MVSAGDRLVQAHRATAAAAGRLSQAIAKRAVRRSALIATVRDLEQALNEVKLILDSPPTAKGDETPKGL